MGEGGGGIHRSRHNTIVPTFQDNILAHIVPSSYTMHVQLMYIIQLLDLYVPHDMMNESCNLLFRVV